MQEKASVGDSLAVSVLATRPVNSVLSLVFSDIDAHKRSDPIMMLSEA